MNQPLLKDIIAEIERMAPLAFQEDFDNSGLQTGNMNTPIRGILITLDVSEEVVDEALESNANLIVAHHPVTLKGFKSLTGKTQPERVLMKAIKNDVAIYAAHTSIDSVAEGVSGRLAAKLGLQEIKVLDPRQGLLEKLVTFVPTDHAEKVREAIFSAGAGVIGNYDSCSYNLSGHGSFRAGENTNPFVGEQGEIHYEQEVRVETILPVHSRSKVLQALFAAHPYEEVAYDVYPLKNAWPQTGFGAIGQLPESMEEKDLLSHIKEVTGSECIRHTRLLEKPVKTVAVCGGSGSFLLPKAIASGADMFVSADFKYHQFDEADKKIVIADIGHFESEQFTKEVFLSYLQKNSLILQSVCRMYLPIP